MAQPPSTTELVPLKDILESIVFLKDGSLRAVIDVSAINFELRSTDEQIALLQQFQGFLNSVDFPLQVVVQSRKYDIDEYLKVVEKATAVLTNDMLRVQAEEYTRYIRELSELANIMKKKFYVVTKTTLKQLIYRRLRQFSMRKTFNESKTLWNK